jgi:hypothetical protein
MRRDVTEALMYGTRHPGWADDVLTVYGTAQQTAWSSFITYVCTINDASMYLGPDTTPRRGGRVL